MEENRKARESGRMVFRVCGVGGMILWYHYWGYM
jgi:hypothetical protein